MARIEIREYTGGGTRTRDRDRENTIASLYRGQHTCRLTFTAALDADGPGTEVMIELITADPDVLADLMAHDWTDIEATRALCWRIILPRLTGAQIQAMCLEIGRDAWRQGRDDARAVTRAALGLQSCGELTETVVKAVLTP